MAKPGNEKTYKMVTGIKFCSASELHCIYTVTKRYKIKYLDYSRGDSLCWFDLQMFKVIQNFDKNHHVASLFDLQWIDIISVHGVIELYNILSWKGLG